MWNINFPIEGVKYHSDEISALYLKQNAWHEGTAGELLRTLSRRLRSTDEILDTLAREKKDRS